MQELLTPKNLQETYLDWTIIDPLLHARKLNQILRTEEIRQVFHEITRVYEAIRRWEILEWDGFSSYPKLIQPLEGEQYLLPVQLDTMDWRWDKGPGRPALYLDYCLSQSCHWRAKADLAVVQRLLPEYDWIVVSAERHTMVCCPEHQLIWDPTYRAMSVSAQSALHTVFGEKLDGTDYDVYEPEEFEWSEHTHYIINIWNLIDGYPEADRLRIVQGMGDQLDEIRTDDTVEEKELVAA